MATTKQTAGKSTSGLSTKAKNRLPRKLFAFPKQRKEPLHDAKHVRTAIARFDQVKGVTDASATRRGSASAEPRRRSVST